MKRVSELRACVCVCVCVGQSITSVVPVNQPASSTMVTITGLSFATSDVTPSVALREDLGAGSGLCATTAWTSSSTVSCAPPAGNQPGYLSLAVRWAANAPTYVGLTFDGTKPVRP